MWKCENCGAEVENNFNSCWNCGYGKDGVPPENGLAIGFESLPPSSTNATTYGRL
jgi:hypothetical protein